MKFNLTNFILFFDQFEYFFKNLKKEMQKRTTRTPYKQKSVLEEEKGEPDE